MKITKSELQKIIKEEISRELEEQSQSKWHTTVYNLLKNLDTLSDTPKQAEAIEAMVLDAFNEVDTNPEISVILLNKALRGITREKARRAFATNLVDGALKTLNPEAQKMFQRLRQG